MKGGNRGGAVDRPEIGDLSQIKETSRTMNDEDEDEEEDEVMKVVARSAIAAANKRQHVSRDVREQDDAERKKLYKMG